LPDSWGSSVATYDESAASADKFLFEHPDFLAVFAAGNYGSNQDLPTTVTSPATCKNGVAVGATMSWRRQYTRKLGAPVVDARVEIMNAPDAPPDSDTLVLNWRIVAADWAPAFETLGGRRLQLFGATDGGAACTPGSGDLARGGVLIALRSAGCNLATKIQTAAAGGAVALLLATRQETGYAVIARDGAPATMPVGGMPLSMAQQLRQYTSTAATAFVGFSRHEVCSCPSYEDIASYSSFGPTADRRVKPDVVAPGDVTSAYSDGKLESVADACRTMRKQGTSMAAPVVAGNVALARQYFMAGFYPSGARNPAAAYTPSGVLLKAVLLGGASDMQGYTEVGTRGQGRGACRGPGPARGRAPVRISAFCRGPTFTRGLGLPQAVCLHPPSCRPPPRPAPNPARPHTPAAAPFPSQLSLPLEPAPSFRQGFGRLNLTRATPVASLSPPGWRLQFVDLAALAEGESHTYCINVTGDAVVTLVWYDFPATPAAGVTLQNDLDLVVSPAGRALQLRGNGWHDNLNTVRGEGRAAAGAEQAGGGRVSLGLAAFAAEGKGDPPLTAFPSSPAGLEGASPLPARAPAGRCGRRRQEAERPVIGPRGCDAGGALARAARARLRPLHPAPRPPPTPLAPRSSACPTSQTAPPRSKSMHPASSPRPAPRSTPSWSTVTSQGRFSHRTARTQTPRPAPRRATAARWPRRRRRPRLHLSCWPALRSRRRRRPRPQRRRR
jgi:hypothetical protein